MGNEYLTQNGEIITADGRPVFAGNAAGNEPTNTTPATLTQVGIALVINRGTWNAHNNGTLTGYFANIYRNAVFVEQILLPTQATDYTPDADGSYTAEVNVSNTAGWADVERSVTSATLYAGPQASGRRLRIRQLLGA